VEPFLIQNGSDRVLVDHDDVGLVAEAIDQILTSEEKLKTTWHLRSWGHDHSKGHIDWDAERKVATIVRSCVASPLPDAIQAVSAVEVPFDDFPDLLQALTVRLREPESNVAGYGTLDGIIDDLRKLPPEQREAMLRQWLTGEGEKKERHVAWIMCKLRERELH
jgi:hypothetical protein